LEKLPIEQFYGIGKVTADKMKRLGIHNGWDLKQFSLNFLVQRFGKSGSHYFNIVRGVHLSEVRPNRERKSLSVETTFENDLFDREEIVTALEKLLAELFLRIHRNNLKGRTLTLKLKFRDFTLQTRSKSLPGFLSDVEMGRLARELVDQKPLKMPIRLMGVGVSNFEKPGSGTGSQLRFEY